MFDFLLDTYNSGAIDTPTNSFGGSSVNVEIGNNTRIYQVLIISAILICVPITVMLIKKHFSKTKTNRDKNNKNDE